MALSDTRSRIKIESYPAWVTVQATFIVTGTAYGLEGQTLNVICDEQFPLEPVRISDDGSWIFQNRFYEWGARYLFFSAKDQQGTSYSNSITFIVFSPIKVTSYPLWIKVEEAFTVKGTAYGLEGQTLAVTCDDRYSLKPIDILGDGTWSFPYSFYEGGSRYLFFSAANDDRYIPYSAGIWIQVEDSESPFLFPPLDGALLPTIDQIKQLIEKPYFDSLYRLHEFGAQIVDVLLVFLSDKDCSPSLRRGAAAALGAIGKDSEAAVQPLIDILEDRGEDRSLRGAAAGALGALGDSAAVQPLIDILKDSGEAPSLRGAAAYALGALGDSAAVQPLIDILKDSGEAPSLRGAAAYALGALGDSAAVQPLINILKDSGEDTSLRGDAASALGAIADSAAVQPLINILKDSGEDASLRRDAASALGAIGKDAKDAIPSLRSALQDLNADAEHLELKDISTAWASILVDDGNIEELVSLLKDPTSKYVRAAAALGLTELGQEAEVTVSDLRERLRSDPDPQVRENVILALGTLGLIGNEAKSAVPELLNALINKGTRVAAALALGVIAAEPDRVVPALMQALKKTRSWPEFEDITLAFRSMRTEAKRFVPDLINTIENANNDNAVRAAIYALAAIGPGAQAAVWPLIELKKKLPFCEETCIDALVEIDSGSAIPFLLSLDLSLGSNPGDHIGKILDKISSTAISALIQYLKAPDLRIRRNVAFALAYTKLPEGVLPLLLDVVRNDDEDIEIRRLIAYGLERTGQDVEDFFAHNHLVPMSRAVCLTRSGIFGTYIGTCEVGWGEGGGIDWFQSLRDYLRRK